MKRSFDPEIIDDPNLPEETLSLVYRDLTRTHRFLGNIRALVLALRRNANPLRRVLDIGCGRGELLLEIQRKMGVEAIGVDVRVADTFRSAVPIMQADAVRDTLPSCDVALAVCVAHHLADEHLVEMIQNVGRFSKRFVILDLVRHPLPLLLFRCFVAPFVHWINAADGVSSIRRSYTPAELESLVRLALQGSTGTYRHSVGPLYIRQIVDISYL
jgi:SAM-dependent methyltransferase